MTRLANSIKKGSVPFSRKRGPSPFCQRGASVLVALFLITGLAILGAILVRLMVHGSTTGIDDWYSEQAFQAAESGVDWAAYQIGSGTVGACDATPYTGTAALGDGSAFRVSVVCTPDLGNGRRLYTITSTGTHSAALGDITRQIIVEYMP